MSWARKTNGGLDVPSCLLSKCQLRLEMLKIGSYFIHKYESKSGETQKMFVCLEGDSDIPSSFSVGGVSGVSSIVFPFFVISVFFYLFVEFPEVLDSSHVQHFSMFQVDKDNVTMNIDGLQGFIHKLQLRNPIQIWMNIKSIQIWVNIR